LGFYEVISAVNGREGIKTAAKEKPDLIIMDIMMPVMDGIEAFIELKKSEETWEIPVIFLSAKGQMPDIEKGLNLGAHAYLVKPFSPARLLAKVNEIINRNAKAAPYSDRLYLKHKKSLSCEKSL